MEQIAVEWRNETGDYAELVAGRISLGRVLKVDATPETWKVYISSNCLDGSAHTTKPSKEAAKDWVMSAARNH